MTVTISRLYRQGLGFGLAAAFLAGCGGQSATALTPTQTMALQGSRQAKTARQASGSSGDLLYVADGKANLLVFSYPGGALVQRISNVAKPWGLCSDSSGNVFVLNRRPYQVLEYAHGGKTPINTLDLQVLAQGCSVDPTTGNLAVPQGNAIAIYQNASGNPKLYVDSTFETIDLCAYDDMGNLFVTGFTGGGQALAELQAGSSTFTAITLDEKIPSFSGVQWDGTDLALSDFAGRGTIYRVKVSGSSGDVIRTTTIDGVLYGWFFWIQDNRVMAPVGTNDSDVDFWPYPKGGAPVKSLRRHDLRHNAPVTALTVSVAPSAHR